jgi:uncharacterized membrane protein
MSHSHPLTDKTRVEAFSDGVFAIALTLLVLDLHVPHLEGSITSHALLNALAQMWPSLLAMLYSFFIELAMWYTHHDLMQWVRGVDKCFLFANGFLLLLVVLIPFPTALLAEYLQTPARVGAIALYIGFTAVAALAFLFFLLAITGNNGRLLRESVSAERIAVVRRAYFFGPVAYAALTWLSFHCPRTALTLALAMWILWLGLDYRGKAAQPHESR